MELVTDSGSQPESQGDLVRARIEGHRKASNMGSPDYYYLKLRIIVTIMMMPSSSEV